MTEQKTKETKTYADMIVKKVRDLIVLEDRVIEARETVQKFSALNDNSTRTDSQENTGAKHQEVLTKLESELKAHIVELSRITDELKWTPLSLRVHALTETGELVRKLKMNDIAEQSQLLTALTDAENTSSPEKLEAIIIARLKKNLERIFHIK